MNLREAIRACAAEEPIPAGIDWGGAVPLIRSHGMIPLVYANVAESRSALRTEFEANALRNLHRTLELKDLLRELAREDIRVFPYKGPVLAREAYGDLSMRQFVDLDLLVSPKDAVRVKERLERLGFRPMLDLEPREEAAYWVHQFEYSVVRGDTVVELHWKVVPDYLGVSLDFEGLAERSMPCDWLEPGARTLGVEDTLLVLCVHGGKHLWERLGWTCDVARWIRSHPDLRWDLVRSLARQATCERLVGIGLNLAARLAAAPIPSDVLQAWVSDPVARLSEHVAHRMFREPAGGLERARFYLATRRGFKEKFRAGLLLTTQSTEREWRWVRLPEALFPLYGWIRPLRLLAEHGWPRRRGSAVASRVPKE